MAKDMPDYVASSCLPCGRLTFSVQPPLPTTRSWTQIYGSTAASCSRWNLALQMPDKGEKSARKPAPKFRSGHCCTCVVSGIMFRPGVRVLDKPVLELGPGSPCSALPLKLAHQALLHRRRPPVCRYPPALLPSSRRCLFCRYQSGRDDLMRVSHVCHCCRGDCGGRRACRGRADP